MYKLYIKADSDSFESHKGSLFDMSSRKYSESGRRLNQMGQKYQIQFFFFRNSLPLVHCIKMEGNINFNWPKMYKYFLW